MNKSSIRKKLILTLVMLAMVLATAVPALERVMNSRAVEALAWGYTEEPEVLPERRLR